MNDFLCERVSNERSGSLFGKTNDLSRERASNKRSAVSMAKRTISHASEQANEHERAVSMTTNDF